MIYKPTLGLIAAGGFRSHPRYRGCVGHWLMNEGGGLKAFDVSGYRNDGTLTNGPTWIAGQFGHALSFGGTNDIISLGASTNLLRNVSQGAISVRAYIKSVTVTRAIIDISVGTSTNSRLELHIKTDGTIELVVRAGDAEGSTSPGTTGTISLNAWHHIAANVDYVNDAAQIYLDGISMALDAAPVFTATSTSDTSPNTVNIGSDAAGATTSPMDGFLDDLRVYNNRRLSPEDAISLYNDPFLEFRRPKKFFFNAAAADTLFAQSVM